MMHIHIHAQYVLLLNTETTHLDAFQNNKRRVTELLSNKPWSKNRLQIKPATWQRPTYQQISQRIKYQIIRHRTTYQIHCTKSDKTIGSAPYQIRTHNSAIHQRYNNFDRKNRCDQTKTWYVDAILTRYDWPSLDCGNHKYTFRYTWVRYDRLTSALRWIVSSDSNVFLLLCNTRHHYWD